MEEKINFKNDRHACRFVAQKSDPMVVLNETKKHKSKDKKIKKQRKSRRRSRSSKVFLQRPKINAPANTTQFLCEDKEYYLPDREKSLNSTGGSTNNSESDSIVSSSSSSSTQLSVTSFELNNDRSTYDSVFWDMNDKRFIEEFERMYDDVRIELLRDHSTNELTTRCVELESAVHNLQYLLKKEIDKRKKMEEFLYLIQTNSRLKEENLRLQQLQTSAIEQYDPCNGSFCPSTSVMTNSPVSPEILGT